MFVQVCYICEVLFMYVHDNTPYIAGEISFKDPAVECYIWGINPLNFFRINKQNYHDKLNNDYVEGTRLIILSLVS